MLQTNADPTTIPLKGEIHSDARGVIRELELKGKPIKEIDARLPYIPKRPRTMMTDNEYYYHTRPLTESDMT